MLMYEFIARTNIYPSWSLFQQICKEYEDRNEWNKDEFCKAYLENRNGIAEKIQKAADAEDRKIGIELRAENTELRQKVETLEKQIEEEKEWRIVGSNYIECADLNNGQFLNDDQAKRIVLKFLDDLHPNAFSIIRRKTVWEKNRHGELRKVTDQSLDLSPWAIYETGVESDQITFGSIAFRYGNEEYVLNITDGHLGLSTIFNFSNALQREIEQNLPF